jgi:ribosomal protein S1
MTLQKYNLDLINNKTNKSDKFYKDVLIQLKTSTNCFNLFDNRVIEGAVVEFNNFFLVDIGFKYLIKMKKSYSLSYYIILKIVKLETLFNDLHVNYMNLKNDLNYKLNWSILKKAFQNKCFVIGRVLNPVRNGFSVGICGFVGFMPKKYTINNVNNVTSVFVINNIDLLKKSFVVSQKQINKITCRTLFKLSSQLIYVSKN